jgi:hypothetical protein
MDLLWKPVVHSPSRVDIPQVAVTYESGALERWIAAYEPWLQSDRADYLVWGEYAELAKGGRFLLPYTNEKKTRRFAELHAALLLHREGFTCWGGVHLFDYGRKVVTGKGNTKANTQAVRSRAPWRWPTDIQDTLNFKPRNPDIVAYSEDRNEWRFCEVKRLGERVDPDQLKALAVLHLLTGAPVAVLRVVEHGKAEALQGLSTEIAYRDGVQLDWLHQRSR